MNPIYNTFQVHVEEALKRACPSTTDTKGDDAIEVRRGIDCAAALATWLSIDRVAPEIRTALIAVVAQMFDGITRSLSAGTGASIGMPSANNPITSVALVTTYGPEQREGMALLFQFLNWVNADERTTTAKEALIRNLIVIAGEFDRAFQHASLQPPSTASTRSH